jgi:hypothetical protein
MQPLPFQHKRICIERVSSTTSSFFLLCLSYCLATFVLFSSPLPRSFFMPCLSCCLSPSLPFLPLFLACLFYYPSLLSLFCIMLPHTHLPSFTNTKRTKNKKKTYAKCMEENKKGIWKKGIEKHCFPYCWKKKRRALKRCFY